LKKKKKLGEKDDSDDFYDFSKIEARHKMLKE